MQFLSIILSNHCSSATGCYCSASQSHQRYWGFTNWPWQHGYLHAFNSTQKGTAQVEAEKCFKVVLNWEDRRKKCIALYPLSKPVIGHKGRKFSVLLNTDNGHKRSSKVSFRRSRNKRFSLRWNVFMLWPWWRVGSRDDGSSCTLCCSTSQREPLSGACCFVANSHAASTFALRKLDYLLFASVTFMNARAPTFKIIPSSFRLEFSHISWFATLRDGVLRSSFPLTHIHVFLCASMPLEKSYLEGKRNLHGQIIWDAFVLLSFNKIFPETF